MFEFFRTGVFLQKSYLEYELWITKWTVLCNILSTAPLSETIFAFKPYIIHHFESSSILVPEIFCTHRSVCCLTDLHQQSKAFLSSIPSKT